MKKSVIRQCAMFFCIIFSSHSFAKKITLGALGDSVTTATNALGWGNQPKYSWATGTSDVYGLSHFLRLEELYGQGNVKVYNKAVMGQETSALETQIQELLPYKPDYVTMLMGGNDICHMNVEELPLRVKPTVLQIEKNIENGIRRLIHANSNVKILLVPIPDLIQVWSYGHEMGCQWMWDLFSVCASVLSSDRSDLDRMLVAQTLKEANEKLLRLAAKHPKHVKINPKIMDIQYNEEFLSSRDCFHPSAKGQGLIAEKSWEKGWF